MMARVTFSSSLLSVSVFAVLTASGLAAGWIQGEAPETERGKQVAVLPLIDSAPEEEVVAALAPQEENFIPPDFGDLPTVLESRRPPDKPLTRDAAAGGIEPDATGFDAPGELVIVLPRGSRQNLTKIEPTAPRQPSLRGDAGDVPDITPVVVAGFGPVTSLGSAPIADLTEAGPYGPLPKIGADGASPRKKYARPFAVAGNKPKIVLVLGGMGLKRRASAHAIEQLPGPVALSFVPYPVTLAGWTRAARAAGHEILVELPMEPFDFPRINPGDKALLTGLDDRENLDRLKWLLARFPGYVGVTNYLGDRLALEPEKIRPVLQEVDQRGLLFLETGTGRRSKIGELSKEIGLPHARSTQIIDPKGAATDPDTVLRRLEALIEVAKAEGSAIGVGLATPVTVNTVVQWSQTLESRGVVLAPISSVFP